MRDSATAKSTSSWDSRFLRSLFAKAASRICIGSASMSTSSSSSSSDELSLSRGDPSGANLVNLRWIFRRKTHFSREFAARTARWYKTENRTANPACWTIRFPLEPRSLRRRTCGCERSVKIKSLETTKINQNQIGSFSAVSTPIFASKYSLESSWRDLHNALLCTAL